MLNCTLSQTPNQLLLEAYSQTARPALLILYVVSSIISLLVGLVMIDNTKGEHPYKKYFLIWIIGTFLIGGVVLFLCFSPFLVNKIYETFSSIIK